MIIKKYYPAAPGQKPQLKECYEVNGNNQKNGFYQSWWPNGQEHVTATYLNDKPINLWEEHHPNGRLAVQKMYDAHGMGQLEGSFKSWRADGSREIFGYNVQDRPCGIFITWNPDNTVRSIDSYMIGGISHGDSIYNDDEKDCIIRSNHRHASLVEEQVFKGSRTEFTQTFSRDDVSQTERRYNPEGFLISEKTTHRNRPGSHLTTYYPGTRQIHCVADTDENGLQTYKIWSESHHLLEEGTKKKGVQVGIRRLYYDLPASPLREECPFENGVEEGICTQYDDHSHPIARYKMHQGNRVLIAANAEIVFGKKREKKLRDDLAQKLWEVLRQPEGKTAVVAEVLTYHGEKSDFPRPTAVKRHRNTAKTRA